MAFAHLLIRGRQFCREEAHRSLVLGVTRLFKAVQAVLHDEVPLRTLFGEHGA